MQKKKLRVGAGKAAIRFPEEYFPQENCSGEHDPVHARAVLLEYGDRMMIVSLELPSLRPFTLIDSVKTQIRQATGVPEENIWVCMTHNLSTLHVPNQEQAPEKYEIHMAAVRAAVQEACLQAVAGVQEARLGVGTGTSAVNSSRDVRTNQGWWLGADGEGPCDRLVTVFRFDSPSGKPIAILYHYAIKSSILEGALMKDGMRRSTSDITGRASQLVEEAFGVPALFFMGAAGDQVPRKKAQFYAADENGDCREFNLGEEGFAFLDELGGELGCDVVRAVQGTVCSEADSWMYHTARRWMFRGQQFYDGPRPYRPTRPEEYRYRPGPDQELKVELLCLGGAALFGLQPETTAVIGMRLRERAPEWKPLMAAMVNGGKDYLADESSYDRCTFSGTHSVFARGSAEEFVERAAKLLESLKLPEASEEAAE